MKVQFPSLFFVLYRRFTLSLNYGRFFNRRWVGTMISWVFARIVRFRKPKPSSAYRSNSLVVSVGNIVLGGAGKTPTVLWLHHMLQQTGISCAILSRGYRGACSKQKGYEIVDHRVHNAAYVGDEPLLMAKQLPDRTVWVNKDRRKLAQEASKMHDVLILDDGLQYNKLHKDIEVVVVNGQDPFGGEAFFPKGRLRDFPKRLQSVDYIIVNGACEQKERELLNQRSSAPKIFVKPKIAEVIWEPTLKVDSAENLAGMGVGVFCGLGFPQGFLNMLAQAGVHILGKYILPDHVGITKKELNYFCKSIALRKGVGVLCTEKDRIKLTYLDRESFELPIGTVRTVIQVDEGEEYVKSLLDTIGCKLKKR